MHDTALKYGQIFFEQYVGKTKNLKIVDIGAQDINGSLKSVVPSGNSYIGVDFVEGKGVDLIIEDPYVLPIETASVDVVVSSSCLEHSEFFWLTFNEMLRILKPAGLLYINTPSNGVYHRYPVDCWRFYPDSGAALQNWGRRSGYDCQMLESFIGTRETDIWHDFVAVFVKDKKYAAQYKNQIQSNTKSFINGRLNEVENIFNYSESFQTYPNYNIISGIKKVIKKFK